MPCAGNAKPDNTVVRYEAVTLASDDRLDCSDVSMISLNGDYSTIIILPQQRVYLTHTGYASQSARVDALEDGDAIISSQDGVYWHESSDGKTYVSGYYKNKAANICVGYNK